jgi:SsrA-binding protein
VFQFHHIIPAMAGKDKRSAYEPRINNRRAFHEFFIEAKLECGIVLVGSEVKSVRMGRAQLQEAFARVDGGELILYGCHIDPYDKASLNNHLPLRERKLLVHRREIKKLESATQQKGTTLIPLAMYFKNGMVKVELGIAHGKQHHDQRQAIREKEQDRDMRRQMSRRM